MIDSEKFHEWKVWVSQNKLTTIGSVWLGLMATNLAYQFTRPVPLQLKLIHSRVYSQFVTVAAVGCIGLAEALDPSMKRKKEQDF
ncbi:HIG1 domain-containing protein [Chloropicon roscoffensis]|uniref:HIG1 domain-containing protein n=2 Tax=Chloropicon roscoffensis TaxID=1461544 RepID=A0AAX4P133_9CHLO